MGKFPKDCNATAEKLNQTQGNISKPNFAGTNCDYCFGISGEDVKAFTLNLEIGAAVAALVLGLLMLILMLLYLVYLWTLYKEKRQNPTSVREKKRETKTDHLPLSNFESKIADYQRSDQVTSSISISIFGTEPSKI